MAFRTLGSSSSTTKLWNLQRSTIRIMTMRQNRTISLSSYLVTPNELHGALKKSVHSKLSTAPRIIPLCASWFLPNDPEKRTGHQSFKEKRIPKARFFDLDAVKDNTSPYPHMLPSAEEFAAAMGKLGIRKHDSLVVYDTQELGIFSAPRVSWTLQVFGHPDVHLLNNFRLWVEQGYPTESGEPEEVQPVEYGSCNIDQEKVANFEQVKEVAQDHGKEGAEGIQVLDARSRGRWEGTEPEPRPGLPSGHMPGSVSVPVADLLDPKTKAFLSAEELRKVFQSKGVDPAKPVISSCGTGVTAAVIDTALQLAGYGNEKQRWLYDGSWTEWAQRVKPSEHLIIQTRSVSA